ncbi:Pentatricopeptide repeat-containing protein, partial [Frankliniella fusca]
MLYIVNYKIYCTSTEIFFTVKSSYSYIDHFTGPKCARGCVPVGLSLLQRAIHAGQRSRA